MSDVGGWTPIVGSVRGSAHERDGRPNQDAVATRALGPDAMAVAVADGHGGSRYVRSDVGSALAVQAACTEAATWWSRHGGRAPDAAGERSLARDWFPAVVRRWRQEVLDHLASAPFTADERTRAGVQALEADPFVSYGATLLVVLAGPHGVWLAQLGDGDSVVALADGSVVLPVPGDDRLVGGQTTSLALSSAAADLRVASVAASRQPRLVLLASDGYGNSFADERWHETTVRDFVAQLAAYGPDGVAQRLPEWLAASAAAGGDDTTVALLCAAAPAGAGGGAPAGATAGVLPAPSAVAAPAAAAPVGRTPADRPDRRGPGRVLAALAVVAALAAGAAVGWVARGDGEPAAVAPSTTAAPEDGEDGGEPELPTDAPTSVPGGVDGSGDGRVVVVDGLDGGMGVAFTADPDDPDARRLELDTSRPAAPVQLALGVAGRAYRIVDGDELEVDTAGELARVDLDGRGARALAWAGGSVWVVSADGAWLGVLGDGGAPDVVAWHRITAAAGSGGGATGTTATPPTTPPPTGAPETSAPRPSAPSTTTPRRPGTTAAPPTTPPGPDEEGPSGPPPPTPAPPTPSTVAPPSSAAPSTTAPPPTTPAPSTTSPTRTSTPPRVGI